MTDTAYDQLVAAELEIDDCRREFIRLRPLLDDANADVQSEARRAWAAVFARHQAAERAKEAARDA